MSNSVTICTCASRSIVDQEKVRTVAGALVQAGYEVELVADLCEKIISARDDINKIASSTVIACYSRAVSSLFNSVGVSVGMTIDIRNCSSEEILKMFDITDPSKNLEMIMPDKCDPQAEAWYPVIDKERCTECGKCHDYCLFGVYSKVNGEIKVQNPRNCKNNCPACARVCPQKAIIFPKYPKSPINGGLIDEEPLSENNNRELYGDALRLRLMQRRGAGISLLKKNDDDN